MSNKDIKDTVGYVLLPVACIMQNSHGKPVETAVTEQESVRQGPGRHSFIHDLVRWLQQSWVGGRPTSAVGHGLGGALWGWMYALQPADPADWAKSLRDFIQQGVPFLGQRISRRGKSLCPDASLKPHAVQH